MDVKIEVSRDNSSLTSEKFLMTRKELAALSGVSESTIDRERKDGALTATKIRGRVLFSQKSIDKWLGKRSRHVS